MLSNLDGFAGTVLHAYNDCNKMNQMSSESQESTGFSCLPRVLYGNDHDAHMIVGDLHCSPSWQLQLYSAVSNKIDR